MNDRVRETGSAVPVLHRENSSSIHTGSATGVLWLLTALYFCDQFTLRAAPSVMRPRLSEGFALSALAVVLLAGGVFAFLGAVYIASKYFPANRAATLIGAAESGSKS